MSINKKRLYEFIINSIVLLSFTYFPDYIFKNQFYTLYKSFCLIIYILIIVVYLKKYKFKIHYMNIILAIMYLIPVLSTYTNGNQDMLSHGIRLLIEMVSLSFYIEYSMREKKLAFLKDCMIYYGLLVIINIISFYIYYPNGMEGVSNFYFLGNDNGSIYESSLFLFISIIYYLKKYDRIPIKFYIILIFIFFGYIYVDSGNGKVCTFLFLLLSLFYKQKKFVFNKRISIKFVLIFYIILYFMFVVWRSNNFIIETALKLFQEEHLFGIDVFTG